MSQALTGFGKGCSFWVDFRRRPVRGYLGCEEEFPAEALNVLQMERPSILATGAVLLNTVIHLSFHSSNLDPTVPIPEHLPDLEPQRGWTVEAGMRGDLGGKVTYDLAAFSSLLANQLVPFEVASAPGRRFYRNVGESRLRGFEASGRTALSSLLTARLSYGYVDARFVEFAVDGADFGDNRVPGIAPHRLEGSLRAGRGSWYGELRLEVRDDVPADDGNQAHAAGFTLLDLRFGATDVALGAMTISPYAGVTNLTDARYASSVVVNAFGGRYFEPGPDRGGYVGVSIAWERR